MLEMNQNIEFQLLDQPDLIGEVKFAMWLYQQKSSNIQSLCDHLKCPKDIKQIAELVSIWQGFSSDFLFDVVFMLF